MLKSSAVDLLWSKDFSMASILQPATRDPQNIYFDYALHRKTRQCSPLRRKFTECSITNPAQLLLMKQLAIGQRQKAPDFVGFSFANTW